MKNKVKKLSTSSVIIIGFLLIILIGTFLLCTPLASNGFEWTNPLTALFTATSATCVTGLVVVDTGTYWSIFGQIVILLMIQIGGMGFMVVISLVAIVFRRKINLHERKLISQANGFIGTNGVLGLILKVFKITGICELIGAVVLSTQFIPTFGWGKGIYYSIFHSISAFCNAGFDIMGNYASLTAFSNNIVVNITIMLLIVIGGLGFLVWSDLFSNKFKWKKLMLHSKIVITTTLFLIFIPTILFFVLERNGAYSHMSWNDALLASFFQSITCRTAGMNTIDQAALGNGSVMLSIVLMLIGGSPGSTAGGIKTTTFAVMLLSIINSARRKQNIVVGKKQLDASILKQAGAVFTFYVTLAITASIILMVAQSNDPAWSFAAIFFETISAIGTVGLSIAGTSSLLIVSKIVIIVLMFVGRIGALSIIFIFSEKAQNADDILQRPSEKILIG